MSDSASDASSGARRIDRWLFAARLFKSRSLAAAAVDDGKVHLNGERVKRSRGVQPGDAVSFMRGSVEFACIVRAIPLRRGPAAQAMQCYDETEGSRTRREEFAARMRFAAALAPRPRERPQKHERQLLRRLRGRT